MRLVLPLLTRARARSAAPRCGWGCAAAPDESRTAFQAGRRCGAVVCAVAFGSGLAAVEHERAAETQFSVKSLLRKNHLTRVTTGSWVTAAEASKQASNQARKKDPI
eukprot:6204324-Pleurochrysis_carterae.AAC.1